MMGIDEDCEEHFIGTISDGNLLIDENTGCGCRLVTLTPGDLRTLADMLGKNKKK